jgi:squalene-hopene/tetraprenyl-beta-curcumene cyclase
MRLALILECCLLSCATTMAADDMQSKEPAEKRPRPSSLEPMAPAFSWPRAAEYLDTTSLEWTRQRNCGSCHTNYPYLLARPSLAEYKSPAEAEIRKYFEQRVAHWDDAEKDAKPRWDAEVVATAYALAMHDSATTGTLHPRTRSALDRIWTLQKPEGCWDWLKCGWPPLEHDDYYGALVAALAVGHAPDGYANQESAAQGLERLRRYFQKTPPPDLHHQTWLLWAATRLDGLMDSHKKEETIRALRAIQRPDGGWCLPSLGQWKRRNGKPNDSAAPSDGYATGLIVLVLREAGVPASDPAIVKTVAWLKSNQRASGRWFTRSLNNDKAHYITDAGTSFAIMALQRSDPSLAKGPKSPPQPAARGN